MKKELQIKKYSKLLKDIIALEKSIADESLPVGYDTRLKSGELEAARTIRLLVSNVIYNLQKGIK